MTSHLLGLDALGATSYLSASGEVKTVDDPHERARQQQIAARKEAAMNTWLLVGLLGTAVGGIAGAWLWSSHRILGLLVGSLLIGGPVGFSAGYFLAVKQAKAKP